MRRSRLVGAAICATAVLVAGACGGMFLLGGQRHEPEGTGVRHETVEVSRRTLTRSVEQPGTLGYGDSWTVGTPPGGTVTWLAKPGSVLGRGSVLAKVDQKSVITMTGALPLYRTLKVGIRGADVRQFEKNLRAMGYRGFTIDGRYSAATAKAVRNLQRKLGRERTGQVSADWLMVLPHRVRVSSREARVGDPAGTRLVSVTATDHLATANLKIGNRDLAKLGSKVRVSLPGRVVRGTIKKIDPPLAKEPEDGGAPDPADATVRVTIRIDKPKALGGLDVTPVRVAFAGEKRADVLAVPVKALLALAEGGYALEVSDGADATTRLVAVEPGMFADGYVEVTPKDKAQLSEGERVVVPS